MSRKIIKNYNRLLAFLLSILGVGSTATFTACGPVGGGCEYGTPHADFKISGVVIDEQNQKIQGIKVVMQYDSVYTDTDGKYKISVQEFPTDQTFPISFIDIDGDKNGKLQELDTMVEFKNPEFNNGSGSWYDGETSKEFNISMKNEKE